MSVQLLIEWPLGTLTFHTMHPSCCYSPIRGVVIRNNVCIVSPSISKIGCHLSGRLIINDEVYTYDTIVFSSKVSLNLSDITNPNIKEVIFCYGGDINVDCVVSSGITFTSSVHTNIYKFCMENNAKYKNISSFRMS